jgi:hypothetical protein
MLPGDGVGLTERISIAWNHVAEGGKDNRGGRDKPGDDAVGVVRRLQQSHARR